MSQAGLETHCVNEDDLVLLLLLPLPPLLSAEKTGVHYDIWLFVLTAIGVQYGFIMIRGHVSITGYLNRQLELSDTQH